MEAIIYTTNTGSAEQYAKILAQETGLPAYSMKEAQKKDPTRCRRDLPGLDHGRYHKRIFSGCQALSGAGCLCRRNGTYGNADGRCPEKELHSRGVPAFYHTGKF